MGLYNTDVPAAARVTTAARRVAAEDHPWVLGYFPVARMNPYQALLYGQGSARGFAVVACNDLDELRALGCAQAIGCASVAHLHWTAPVLARAETESEADERASAFIDQLSAMKRAGTRVVWTVHNRLPHRCEFPTIETQLRRELVDLADVVHVMTDRTADNVADVVVLPPDKTLLVEHPSYLDAYPTFHDPQLVRYETGFAPGEFVAGLLGSIQAYKGIDEFAAALARAREDVANLRGLVAGIPGTDPESLELIMRLEADPAVRDIPARLSDQDMARLASTLDVMVLPYRATLNSGAALLALTFGVPVIGPRLGHFAELSDRGFCLSYDPGDPEGLVAALRAAPDWAPTVDRKAISDYVHERHGPVVSAEFFTGLRRLLGNAAP